MNKHTARMVIGVGIIAFGVASLLGSLDIINFKDFFKDFWPLLVVAGGFLMLTSNPRQFIWPLFVIGWGTLLQLRELEIVDFNIWGLLWPIVIISIGLSVVFNRSQAHKNVNKNELEDLTAILSGNVSKNHSNDYKGGEITAIMGGAELDLRKATIKKEAVINVFAFWGGVTVTVPENWVVKSQITPIAGGVENKTNSPANNDSPVLIISGDVIMGGVEIKH